MDYSSIFKQRAHRYVAASQRFPEVRAQEFIIYLDCLGLHAGELVLDLPCGLGQAFLLIPPGIEYIGLDPAEDFIVACAGTGAQVVQSGVRHMPFQNNSLDVIGSLTGVHHEIQRTELYAEWFRLLRPGGRLVLMDVWAGSRVDVFLNGFVDRWNSQGHAGYFLQQEDLNGLQRAGFSQVAARQLYYSWHAPTDMDMHTFMTDLFGLDLLPDMPEMKQAWHELGWRQAETGCRIPWSLAVVTANKPEGSAYE